MLGFVVLLQGGVPPTPPLKAPSFDVAPVTAPAPAPAAPRYVGPAVPLAPPPRPYAEPFGYPPGPPNPNAPPYAFGVPPYATAPDYRVEEAEVVRWFMRFELGGGPPGFAPETTLLAREGYGGGKMWALLDGAYMLHEHIGLGAFVGMNVRRSAPENTNGVAAPALNEVAYFFGAEVPILIVGSRDIALHLIPRVGFVSGQTELTPDKNGSIAPSATGSKGSAATALDTPFRNAPLWGGEIGVSSFTYHVGAALGLLRGVVSPTGDLGRSNDHGGFYFAVEGSIDG